VRPRHTFLLDDRPRVVENCEYLMINSLNISNFRGFRDIELSRLSLINVIVGDNGSGKTALLESLFLTGGIGPEIYLRIRAWRGAGDKIQFGLDRDQYEALWKEIFPALDQNKAAILSFIDSESGARELRIYYDESQTTLMPMDMNVRTSYESGDIHPITFEWRTEKGEPQKIAATVTSQGIIQLPQTTKLYPITFFAATSLVSSDENAKRFSFLSRRKRQGRVVAIIRSLFPLVQDISVEIVAGGPALFASVENLDEKLAVGSLSGGLGKYLGYLIAIASNPKGVVLIDEIENGFFYKKYGDVWSGLTTLAREHETQLFISTHSFECLNAALPEVEKDPSLFSLFRTERKQRECIVRAFGGKDFLAGLEQRIDFR